MGDDPAYGRTLSLQTSRISNRQPNSICSCIAISRITNKPRLHTAASPPTSRKRSTKSLFALLLPLYPIWRIGFNHTYQHLFLKRPAHHHISSVFSIMYHESLGIPRTKPALNLLYSVSPLLPYHAKGETGLMGELVIFQAQQWSISFSYFCFLILPFSLRPRTLFCNTLGQVLHA